MRPFFILYFIFSSVYLEAQITLLEKYPFQSGEIGTYDVIYEWGIIELHAGIVEFSVDSSHKNNEAIYHFQGTGNSVPKYDWVYKIRDTFRSQVKAVNFQPLYYRRNTFEGNYQVNNETFFQPEESRILMHLDNSEKGFRQRSLPYDSNILDLQTAVYFARLLNFKNASMGDEFTFNIIVDGEPYLIPIRYEGKELVHISKEDSYTCFRISTQVIEGTIFKSHQTIKIWVSDDGKQVPIKVEAPIIVGKVKAELKSYQTK